MFNHNIVYYLKFKVFTFCCQITKVFKGCRVAATKMACLEVFLGGSLFQIRQKLQKLFTEKLTSCNLKIVFTSSIKLKSYFTFKNKSPKMLGSGFVYTYKGGCCNVTYYGENKNSNLLT